jgi:FAD binding domain
MRHGRLFLAGDAAHIVPPTGAKGLNLALSDVVVLANALHAALVDKAWDQADAYSDTCLDRVWRATHFSWWMTSMLHVNPEADGFDQQLMLNQLRYVTSSRAAALSLAENYTGYQPVRCAFPLAPGPRPPAPGPRPPAPGLAAADDRRLPSSSGTNRLAPRSRRRGGLWLAGG